MDSNDQPGLVEDEPQPDLFGTQAAPAYRPDPDRVRARLNRILAETRAAEALPRGRASLFLTIFPQMTLWLPEDKAAQFRFEFEAQMKRLEVASG